MSALLRFDVRSWERSTSALGRVPWNKGKLTGQKPPLKLKEIWAIRIRLQLAARTRAVQFEITELTRDSAEAWIKLARLSPSVFLFPGRIHGSPHLSTRQYARLVHRWIGSIGLDDTAYGTRTMRRTKASLVYRRTKNLRAVQLLLGHTKLESTMRYLGIEVDDALEMAEQTEA